MQLLLTALTLFCIFLWSPSEAADCSSDGPARVISVDQRGGGGQFTTVQAAIDSVAPNNDQWITIQIKPGTYEEMVTIPRNKPCIFLKGESRESTIIAFDSHEKTDTSATFTSNPDNIVVQGITFKNSYNRYWLDADDPPIAQALSAKVYGDKCVFLDCGFLGVQDTLWDASGRHYFHTCYIEGAIDFIFGAGQSIFEDCTMNVTTNSAPYNIQMGWVTAQSRKSATDPSGFVFEGGAVLGAGPFLLGRAYGPYSRVIFHNTSLSSGVAPQGWDAWNFKGKEDKLTYAEVDCQGKGSDTSKRVPWEKQLDNTTLQNFSRSTFLDQEGWLVKTPLGEQISR